MTPNTVKEYRPGSVLPGLVFWATARPHLLVPAWLAGLTGAALGPAPASSVNLIGIVSWSLLLLAVNLVNPVADAATDRINRKNRAWHAVLRPAQLLAGAALFSAVGLGLAVGMAPRLLLPLVLGLGLGLAYSLPPWRLCARPGWDLGAHLVGYAVIAPWLGVLLTTEAPGRLMDPAPLPTPESVLFLVFPVGLTFLVTAVLDTGGDRSAGKITSAVWLADRVPGIASWAARPATRRLLVGATFLGVLWAGWPGLRAWPHLGVPLMLWLGLSYCLQGLTRQPGSER